MQKAVIIINPYCHQGRGWKRWMSIRSEVRKRLHHNFIEVVLENNSSLKEILYPCLHEGESTLLISAGGDGSLHYLINYLLKEEQENARHLTLGAVGLGSSNDFLKPFSEKIKTIPVRINQAGGTVLHDVGLATYSGAANVKQQKFFIVNASAGVTAEANWNFNHPGLLLSFLKKQAADAAIIYTAIQTILCHHNTDLFVKWNEKNLHMPVSNINILKVPFVSGNLFYRQPVMRDDGKLGLNICMNMSRLQLLAVLQGLQRGRFPASAKTLSEFTTDIQISADRPFVFECDGETEKTSCLQISIVPSAISVLQN